MKVEIWFTGKTTSPYLLEGMAVFEKRLLHYGAFRTAVLPTVKNAGKLPPERLLQAEGEVLLAQLRSKDYLALLDENGTQFTSVEFARWLEIHRLHSSRRLIFAVGGAWGFSGAVRSQANFSLSLSRMTFSHQMVRLFFLEQLYRAMTILKREPYHNE